MKLQLALMFIGAVIAVGASYVILVLFLAGAQYMQSLPPGVGR